MKYRSRDHVTLITTQCPQRFGVYSIPTFDVNVHSTDSITVHVVVELEA